MIPIDQLVIAYSHPPNLSNIMLLYRKICKLSGPTVSSYLWLDISRPLLVFKPATSLPSATCLPVWKLNCYLAEGVSFSYSSSFSARDVSIYHPCCHCHCFSFDFFWNLLDPFCNRIGILTSKTMLKTDLCLKRSPANTFIIPLKSKNKTLVLCLVN